MSKSIRSLCEKILKVSAKASIDALSLTALSSVPIAGPIAKPKPILKEPVNADQEGALKGFEDFNPPHHRFEKWSKTYLSSLVGTSVALPIIASAATVCFYFTPGFALPFALLNQSSWDVPLAGVILALIATLILAVCRSPFATAEGANMYCYGQLKSRQSRLKARLGVEDGENSMPKFIPLPKMKQATGMGNGKRCSESALREAYAAYGDICHSLCIAHSGPQWVTGAGYINTWEMIHRTEEALIEVEPVETIVREAINDWRAIESSAINNRDDLLENLTGVIKDLDPDASVYIKDHQADKNHAGLQQELKQQKEALDRVVEKHNEAHPDKKIPLFGTPAAPDEKVERRARGILREVRHARNSYRDSLRQGLVRARNHLLTSIALTGITTYVLLFVAMLLDQPSHLNKGAFLAATAFYLVGTVAGLFGRFYDESISTHVADNYGLSTARLIAIPLLSGLAGIGGVLVTAVLPVLSGQHVAGLDMIFSLTSQSLFAAAVFGFTPNLLIKSFQQRTQEYESKLRSSETTGTGSDKK